MGDESHSNGSVALFLFLASLVVGGGVLTIQPDSTNIEQNQNQNIYLQTERIHMSNNSIWIMPSALTLATAQNLANSNIQYVYPLIGDWEVDGTISYHDNISAALTTATVTNGHAAGLKVYAWVGAPPGIFLPLATAIQRQTAVNSLVSLVQTYGFDGAADDNELWHIVNDGADFVTFCNAATTALNAVGKEFFTTLVMGGYWETEPTLFSQIHVDRIQPMLYLDYSDIAPPDPYPHPWMIETRFKSYVVFCLTYASSPVGLGIGTGAGFIDNSIYYSLLYIDQQLAAGCPTAYLDGIDLFWHSDFTAHDWDVWNARVGPVAPVFTPSAGTYSNGQTVVASTSTAGASVYYTVDGSTPTSNSTLYSAAISVGVGSTTLKAVAILAGTSSSITTAQYLVYLAQYFTLEIMQGTGGYTSPQGVHSYLVGHEITVTAYPNENYTFTRWLLNGTYYSNDATVSVLGAVNTVYTLQPEYTADEAETPDPSTWALTITTDGHGSEPVAGHYLIDVLSLLVFAVALPTYKFKNYLVDGALSTTNPLTLTAVFGSSHTLHVRFEPDISSDPLNPSTLFRDNIAVLETVDVPTFTEILDKVKEVDV